MEKFKIYEPCETYADVYGAQGLLRNTADGLAVETYEKITEKFAGISFDEIVGINGEMFAIEAYEEDDVYDRLDDFQTRLEELAKESRGVYDTTYGIPVLYMPKESVERYFEIVKE